MFVSHRPSFGDVVEFWVGWSSVRCTVDDRRSVVVMVKLDRRRRRVMDMFVMFLLAMF